MANTSEFISSIRGVEVAEEERSGGQLRKGIMRRAKGWFCRVSVMSQKLGALIVGTALLGVSAVWAQVAKGRQVYGDNNVRWVIQSTELCRSDTLCCRPGGRRCA